jgi:hypothetical protein
MSSKSTQQLCETSILPEGSPSDLSGQMPKTYILPALIVLGAALAMLVYGPITQPDNYHDFADQRSWLGIPNAADVLSNLGFALIGLYGMHLVWQQRDNPALSQGRPGYALFFAALLLTAFGSGWYHLVPDNARLVWDRLPIALACAGLLAAVWRETLGGSRWIAIALIAMAICSVAWWRYTELQGLGDLRPYLLLQAMPLVLIPLLQWQHRSPSAERQAFAVAIGLYVLAKVSELNDHAAYEMLAIMSGHTLKHLLATLASGVVAWCLTCRLKEPC